MAVTHYRDLSPLETAVLRAFSWMGPDPIPPGFVAHFELEAVDEDDLDAAIEKLFERGLLLELKDCVGVDAIVRTMCREQGSSEETKEALLVVISTLEAYIHEFNAVGTGPEPLDVFLPHFEAVIVDASEAGVGDETAIIMNILGAYYYMEEDFEVAEIWALRAHRSFEALFGPTHPGVCETWNNLALIYEATGRLDEAVAAYGESVAIAETAYGPQSPAVLEGLRAQSRMLIAMGRFSEAEDVLRRVLGIAKKLSRDYPQIEAEASGELALLLMEQEKGPGEATRLARRALKILLETAGPDGFEAHEGRMLLARAFMASDKLEDAERLWLEDLSDKEARLGPDDALLAPSHSALSGLMLVMQQVKLGESHARRAIELLPSEAELPAFPREEPFMYLATAMMEQGQHDEAEDCLSESIRLMSVRIEETGTIPPYMEQVVEAYVQILEDKGLDEATVGERVIGLGFDPMWFATDEDFED